MASSPFKLPIPYRVFFLFVEPISTFVGAFYAHFLPQTYLLLTDAASSPSSLSDLPLATRITLTQLANLYLLFGINEALVLRSTSDLRVWRTFLIGLLIADLGHLYSVSALGPDVYWKFWTWTSMHWGNVAFVYVGAMMRIAFLCGVGMPPTRQSTSGKHGNASVKAA
ncbi:MAG: hypothetical protein M1819_006190 [Sarea resinae]|nr:MAG: hypothetical protein M1819_006190 [Sarea resinae]